MRTQGRRSESTESEDRDPIRPTTPGWVLGLFAVAILVPVTLPVPVLKGLVRERFDVSVTQTSLFLSINMLGAFLTAPLAGALADRTGRRRQWIAIALVIDAICFLGMALDLSFWGFLGIRFIEGCAHIAALSLLLSLASDTAKTRGKGATMGFVGAGMTFGVAMGAALGGQIGGDDPLRPLRVAATVDAITAILAGALLVDIAIRQKRPSLAAIASALKADRSLLVPWTYAFVDRFTVGCFVTAFPLCLPGVYDLEMAEVGKLLALFLVPFSLLSYPAGRLSERFSRSRMLVFGSLLYGIGLASLGFWPVDALPFVMVGLGVVSAAMFVPSLILTQDLAAPEIRSTAMGGFNAAGSIGFLLGPLVAGRVLDVVSGGEPNQAAFAAAFGVAGSTEVLCALLTWPLLRALVRQGRSS